MNKEELISLSEEFMQEAFQANCYYEIIKQYSKNIKEYHEEMSFSSAFYSYTYNALIVATFMELAKVYDNHKYSINVNQLIDICRNHMSFFPQQRIFKTIINGKETIKETLYKHTVSHDEVKFFQKDIEYQKPFNELFGVTNTNVEMTLERYFEFHKWKYDKIKPQINNLLKQRNKIYAHNDEKSLGNIEDIISDFPLNGRDIESLISFALEFCQFILALLTGVNKANKPVNINDWQGTLDLARLGYKYKDLEIKEDVKEFMKEHFSETE